MKNHLSSVFTALFFIIITDLFGQSKQVLLPFHDDVNNLYGYKDSVSGNIVISAKYSKVYRFYEGLAAVNIGGKIEYDDYDDEEYFTGGKWGYINTSGILVIPLTFDWASDFHNGNAVIRKDSGSVNLYQLINTKGTVLTPVMYNDITNANDGNYLVLKNSLWGIIDKYGKELIQCKYDRIIIDSGFIVVTLNDKAGLIDIKGNVIIPTVNNNIFIKKDGFLLVLIDNDHRYYYHKSGMKFDDKTDFAEGISLVIMNNKYGLIDKNLSFIIPCKYDKIDNLYEGFSKIYLDGKYGFLDSSGTEKIPCKYDQIYLFEKGRSMVVLNGKKGYVDTAGNEIVPVKYDELYNFNDNIEKVKLGGKFGLIDIKSGAEIISPKFDLIGKISGNFARSNIGGTPNADGMIIDGRWGLVNSNGIEIIPAKYDYIWDFNEGMAKILVGSTFNPASQSFIGGKYGYINIEGIEVIPAIYSEADDFADGAAKVILDGVEKIINTKGEKFIKKYRNICLAINEDDLNAIHEMIVSGTNLNEKYPISNDPLSNTEYPIFHFFDNLKLPHMSRIDSDSIRYEFLVLFIKHGSDLNKTRSNFGRPFLVNLISHNYFYTLDFRIKATKLLIENKIDVNAKFFNSPRNCSIIDYFASSANKKGDDAILQLLIDNGADISNDGSDKVDGSELIKRAKKFSSKEVVEILKQAQKTLKDKKK